MLGPSRPVPRVGVHARIKHFGGGSEPVTVTAVHDDGRRLQVRGEDGELHEFVLSPANARFVSATSTHGPRLELVSDEVERLARDGRYVSEAREVVDGMERMRRRR